MIPLDTDKIKLFLILKAKRRSEGEVWTQPSGRKVTKKNGKIVPLRGQGRKKKEEPEKKEKKVSALDEKKYYTRFSKYLDKLKKLTGIGRSEVIKKKISDSYQQAKEKGLIKANTDFDKFHQSYLEYFTNKEKWDKHFEKVSKMDFSQFKNPSITKAVKENLTPKGIKKQKKPFDKKIIKMLYEQNKPKEVILESGQPIELDPETRFNEYLAGDKKILTGRQSLTQLPKTNYLSGDLQSKLLPHQKDAVNLAMDKFNEGQKGFLLADGTGTGKTVQALALADSYLKTSDGTKPIIILTESDNILNTAWMNDAKMLGLEINNAKENGFIPGKINITTYSQAEKVKDYPDKGLLIFDEAHNLKNMDGKNAQNIQEAIKSSDHVFNATATPIDKIEQIDYLCDSFGLDSRAVKKAIETKDPIQTALNLTSFFEDVTRKGLMVKREVPMSNMDIEIANTKFSAENQAKLDKIMQEVKATGNKKLFPQVRRLLEEFKVDQAMDDLVKDISEGKQVVLFADRVSDSNIMGFDSPGTLPLLEKKLKEKGIPFESIFGGSSSEKERQEVKNKVDRFQSGQSKVIIGNPDSMGTGINLDDVTGNAPRTLKVLTTPYSAMDTIQILGRINRLKTKSRAKATFYKHENDIDNWNVGILKDKLTTLGASVSGDYAEIDLDKQGIPTKGVTKEPPPINIDDYKKGKEMESEDINKSKMGIDLDLFKKFFQILKARTVKYFKRIPNPSGGKQKWKYFYTQAEWNKHISKHHKDNPHHPDIIKEAIERTVKESSEPKKPSFSLEQEDKTLGEKKNQAEHSQGKLFGNTGKEKFVKKDFRPKIAEPQTTIPSEYITGIKDLLLKEGLDNRAKEFVGEAMKAENLSEIKEIASKYVDGIKREIPSENKTDKPTESLPEAKKTINPKYLPNDNQWKGIQEGNSDTLTRFANKLWTENGESSALANSINKGRLDQDSLNDAKQEAMILLWQKHQSGAFKDATPQNLVSYLNKVLHFKINEVSKTQNKQVFGSDFLDKIEMEHGINPEDEYIQKEDLKEQVKNIQEQIETMKQAVTATQKNQWSTSERNQKVWDKYLSNYKSGKPNYKAIAQEFDLGENQVKQIIKNIKAKLKKSLNSSDSVVVSKPKNEPKTKKANTSKKKTAKKETVSKTTKKKLKTIFSVWLGREEI